MQDCIKMLSAQLQVLLGSHELQVLAAASTIPVLPKLCPVAVAGLRHFCVDDDKQQKMRRWITVYRRVWVITDRSRPKS